MNEITVIDPQIINDEILTERLDFLKEVRNSSYEAVRKVWVLVPPATWQMYLLLGQKRLREQVLLRQALKGLKKSWSDRFGRAPQPEEYPDNEEAKD